MLGAVSIASPAAAQRIAGSQEVTVSSRAIVKRLLANGCVGVVTAFTLLCPHMRLYTTDFNRYYTFWSRGDALGFTIAILLLGFVFLLAHVLVKKLNMPRMTRVADAVFVAVLGCAAVAYLSTEPIGQGKSWWNPTCAALTWMVMILSAASLLPRLACIPRALRMGGLIVSPVVPLVLFQMFQYPQYALRGETLTAPPQAAGVAGPTATGLPRNVYLVVFDAWSYRRTFAEPGWEQSLPNLAGLVSHASVYHDARSPYIETLRSLPSILFQTSDKFVFSRGNVGLFDASGEYQDIHERENVFSRMKRAGYLTSLVGWKHPYRLMFREELDFCHSTPNKLGNGDAAALLGSAVRHLCSGLTSSVVALPKPAAMQWRLTRYSNISELDYTARRAATIHKLAISIVTKQSDPSFAVFHYPIPHAPYIFTERGVSFDLDREWPLARKTTADGRLGSPDPENRVARYAGNLRYTDTLLGELIEAMKSSGHYEDSMIILTSDHSWWHEPDLDGRFDPYFQYPYMESWPEELQHVPLVVKHPHQIERQDVADRFPLTRLLDLIQSSREANRQPYPHLRP